MLPIVRGSSSRTSGCGRGSASSAAEVDRGPPGERDDAGARRLRRELGHRLGGDRRGPLGQRAGEVRRQLGRQLLQPPSVDRDGLQHLGAEAQRVLERVEALQHGEPAVPAGAAVTADQRLLVCLAHTGIMHTWTAVEVCSG